MREAGACELPGFVRPDALATFVDDARRLAPLAHRSGGPGTIYLGFPDETFAADHPRQWLGNYGVGAVAYDRFPDDSPIRQLFEWDELRAFVAAILGLDTIYPYADPLGALNLAVMGDGDECSGTSIRPTSWCRWRCRTPTRAATSRSRRSPALVVFAGRYSMHRVAPIHGPTPRLVGLFGYDTRPGTMSSELLKAVRYGRVA